MLKSTVPEAGISLGQFVDHEHVVTLVIDEPRAIFLARISDVLGSLPRVVRGEILQRNDRGQESQQGSTGFSPTSRTVVVRSSTPCTFTGMGGSHLSVTDMASG